MQLIPRYLVNNRTTIITNEAGFITEYKPVYQRQLKVYRGINNVLDFKVLNADQKPIDVSAYTPKFQAFDENNRLILEYDGTAVPSDDSSLVRGLFQVTVSENDLLNVKQQYIKYNIHLVDAANSATLTYTDTHFGMDGIIYVSSQAFPGPSASLSISAFAAHSDNSWYTGSVIAQPAINGNEALHTAVVYTNAYQGEVVVQATLDNQVTDNTSWADVATVVLGGTESEPTPVNFNGVFSHLRFKATANPADKITKILIRN